MCRPSRSPGEPIDRRADVYSLGCVLYECLTGERPFGRETELALVYAHLNDSPPRVTDLRPELPETLDGVVATALAKAPDDRYASCGELVTAFRAALTGKPSGGVRDAGGAGSPRSSASLPRRQSRSPATR